MQNNVENSSAKTVLILGTLEAFEGLVRTAMARGMRTLVADGYSDGVCRDIASDHFDVSVFDPQSIAKLCKQQNVDAIVTGFSDLLFESATKSSAIAGLPTTCNESQLEYLRDKSRMKEMFDACEIRYAKTKIISLTHDATSAATPAATSAVHVKDTECECEHVCEDLQFPCVMKPLDAYGSYGVTLVQNSAHVKQNIEKVCALSKSGNKAIIEEYMSGLEFNATTWICDGRVHLLSIASREKSQEDAAKLPYVTRIVYPSVYTNVLHPTVTATAQKIVDFLGLDSGPLSLQFFWDPDKACESQGEDDCNSTTTIQQDITLCEVAGRVFGYEHRLLYHASGLKLENLLLDTAFDTQALRESLKNHDATKMNSKSCGLYFHVKDGEIANMETARSLTRMPQVAESQLYYSDGDTVMNGKGGRPYVASYYIKASSHNELDKITSDIFKKFSVCDLQGNELSMQNTIESAPTEARNNDCENFDINTNK